MKVSGTFFYWGNFFSNICEFQKSTRNKDKVFYYNVSIFNLRAIFLGRLKEMRECQQMLIEYIIITNDESICRVSGRWDVGNLLNFHLKDLSRFIQGNKIEI